jgi:hypothetical protein
VKAILALIVLSAAGFALAACGSGAGIASRPGTTSFTGPITTTIADVHTSDAMTCDDMAGAQVPRPGHGVTNNADGTSRSATLQLNRLADGSLVVSCTP